MNATSASVNTVTKATKSSRPRILVVDDEPDLLEILALELKDAGYDVTCAESGRDAVGYARGEHFDIVLTDYKMPGMDGLEALSAIEKADPNLRAVLMTGYASDEVQTALRMSGRPHIAKPFEVDDLLTTLERERRR